MAIARQKSTIDYKGLAEVLGCRPPGQIQAVTSLLEALQEDDANLNRPQLAAIVISKAKDPIPRPGFFQQLRALGVYDGPDSGSAAAMWHQNELERVFEFYQTT